MTHQKLSILFLVVLFSSTACEQSQPLPVPGCFVAETPIDTPRGAVPIASLVPGDLVLSYDVRTGMMVPRPIEGVITHRGRQTWSIEAGDLRVAGVTAEHPFYEASEGAWVEAADLRVGDRLLARNNDEVQRADLTARGRRPGLHTVYDLTVDGPEHNFFAHGVLVHNKSPVEEPTVGSVRVEYGFLYDADTNSGVAASVNGVAVPPYVAFSFSSQTEFSQAAWYQEDCSASFLPASVGATFALEEAWWFGFEGLGVPDRTDCDDPVYDALFEDGLMTGLQAQDWQFAIGGPVAEEAIPWVEALGAQDYAVGATVVGEFMGGPTPAFAIAVEVSAEGAVKKDEYGYDIRIPTSQVREWPGLTRAFYRVQSVPRNP